MIARFEGETREDSIVNHFSLDIEEQDLFFAYVNEMGYNLDSDDDILENLIKMWRKNEEENGE
jgi:hypothetical protein